MFIPSTGRDEALGMEKPGLTAMQRMSRRSLAVDSYPVAGAGGYVPPPKAPTPVTPGATISFLRLPFKPH